jgi:hypothetical protein
MSHFLTRRASLAILGLVAVAVVATAARAGGLYRKPQQQQAYYFVPPTTTYVAAPTVVPVAVVPNRLRRYWPHPRAAALLTVPTAIYGYTISPPATTY